MKSQLWPAGDYINIINCTFYNNHATNGEGVATNSMDINEPFEFLIITNSIFWDEGLNSELWFKFDETLDVSFSNIQGGYSGIGNIDEIPQFVSPANNNFHLSSISPCINTGDNYVEGIPEYDFDGNNRIHCDFVDMGAFESGGRCGRIYVKQLAAPGGDGTSWNSAYRDLEEALDEATSGTQIWIAKGTYYPSENDDKISEYGPSTDKVYQNNYRNFKSFPIEPMNTNNSYYYTFAVRNGISLYGGFLGISSETSLDDRDWEQNPTILSGNTGDINDPSDNCGRVIFISNSNAIIDGIIITDAVFSGIHMLYSGAELKNCKVENNIQGINAWYDCRLNITNCEVRNNTNHISNHAAGISVFSNSFLNIEKCLFTNNQSANSGGGAISCLNSIANLENSIFVNNIGSTAGAFETDADAEIIFCTFYNNYSNTGEAFSTIYSSSPNVVLSNSILWNTTVTDHVNLSHDNVMFCDISDENYTQNSCFNSDPFFVDPSEYDFHLYSTTRYYDNMLGWLVHPTECSPCINSGDPNINCSEPDGEAIVNIGAFGNTEYASFGCSGSFSNKSSISEDNKEFPNSRIKPNPVRQTMLIDIYLADDAFVNIAIFDVTGKIVKFSRNKYLNKGKNTINWNISNVPSSFLPNGVYLVKIETDDYTDLHKIVVSR